MLGGLLAIVAGLTGFIKSQFENSLNFVTEIIGSLADRFGGAFNTIRDMVESFVRFFTGKFQGIQNIISTVGGAISGITNRLGRNRGADIPGHADGGIFTHRHIAEIAEKGAEAVVPLNNTPGGFDIWKRAGEIGGYLQQQAQKQQSGASITSQAPPVMSAAAKKISRGDNIITLDFKMNNTFTGGTPDSGIVSQIEAAGQRAGESLKSQIKTILEELAIDDRRCSYV
jgi:hypothetical protein